MIHSLLAPTCNSLETDLRTLPHLNPCKTDFTYFQDSKCNAAQYSVDKYRIYRVEEVPTCMPTVLTGLEIEKKIQVAFWGLAIKEKMVAKCQNAVAR